MNVCLVHDFRKRQRRCSVCGISECDYVNNLAPSGVLVWSIVDDKNDADIAFGFAEAIELTPTMTGEEVVVTPLPPKLEKETT